MYVVLRVVVSRCVLSRLAEMALGPAHVAGLDQVVGQSDQVVGQLSEAVGQGTVEPRVDKRQQEVNLLIVEPSLVVGG
jgi:hypothetical protein